MNYYIHENDKQSGPFSIEQLKSKNITQHTHIWRNDLPDWLEAKDIKELQTLINSESNIIKPPPFLKNKSSAKHLSIRRILSSLLDFGALLIILVMFSSFELYDVIINKKELEIYFLYEQVLDEFVSFNPYNFIVSLLNLNLKEFKFWLNLDILIFIFILVISYLNSSGKKFLGKAIFKINLLNHSNTNLTFLKLFLKYLVSFTLLDITSSIIWILFRNYFETYYKINIIFYIISILAFSFLNIIFLFKTKGEKNLVDYVLKISYT